MSGYLALACREPTGITEAGIAYTSSREITSQKCVWERGILVGVLHGAQRFQAFWRLLVVEPLGSFPLLSMTDEAVRKRLLALGPGTCAQLYQRLCDLLPPPPISQSTLPLACFAHGMRNEVLSCSKQ